MNTRVKNIVKSFFATVAILGTITSNSIDGVVPQTINNRSSFLHQNMPFDSSIKAVAKLTLSDIREIRTANILGISKAETRKMLTNISGLLSEQVEKLNLALDLMTPLVDFMIDDIKNSDINELSSLASNMQILYQALSNLTKIVKIKDSSQITNLLSSTTEKISAFLYQINLAKIAQTRNKVGYIFDSEKKYSEVEIHTILFGD